MADKPKFSLHDLKSVNTVLGMLYDENGKYRAGFKPEEFYNTILLDTLKYGEENYVHLKYAETVNISKSQSVARFRRWAGMTPTIRPMIEGIPPAPDKHAYEYMEVGNVFSFGRWSEYTDQIDMSVVSDIVSERAVQYGENANQTKELYARKAWLASPNEYFANFRSGFEDLLFNDAITIDDLRFLTARMKRMQVKPISGKFNYICSPEFINGLIDDPRVKMYMSINQTTGNLWTSGEVFPLFDLNFIPTMLDEFAYPDTEYPGVYEKNDGHEVIRLYAISGNTLYYMDVLDDFVVADGVKAKKVDSGVHYLSDGTAIENYEYWEIPKTLSLVEAKLVASTDEDKSPSSTKVVVRKSTITKDHDSAGLNRITYGDPAYATSADLAAVNGLIATGAFMQLPVHRGILFGDEAMIKINKEGLSDAPRIIIKPLGSAGVLDPLDQRQSVGYRVDGFGLAIKRPEAICITYGIPKNAEFAALTSAYIAGEPTRTLLEYEGDYVEDSAGNKAQALVVDAVNNPFNQDTVKAMVDAYNKYAPFTNSGFSAGALVQYKGVPYKVKSTITTWAADAWAAGTYSEGDLVSNGGKNYKITSALTSSDSNFATIVSGDKAVELTAADTIAQAFEANKSKLVKVKDTLFTNLIDAANRADSNVK